MRRRGWLVAAVLAVAAVAVTTAALGARTSHPDPRKAAAVLVRSLRPAYADCQACGSFGVTKVVNRNGHLWLDVAAANQKEREFVFVYRWDGSRWRRMADVKWRGWGSTQWPSAVSLTGSLDPDFAIQGCGAADTNCLSVVSDVGGRWHVVPFEYGYDQALVVNGVTRRHHVVTEVDACSCAGGPSTWTYERYSNGVFRPTRSPGRRPPCSATSLEAVAGQGEIPLLQFDRVVCLDGWAIGVGTGAGYTGRSRPLHAGLSGQVAAPES